jgi:hypothetical protein
LEKAKEVSFRFDGLFMKATIPGTHGRMQKRLTKNDWQDDAAVNADADDDGHEIPAQTLECFSKVVHFQDLAGNLEWEHSLSRIYPR